MLKRFYKVLQWFEPFANFRQPIVAFRQVTPSYRRITPITPTNWILRQVTPKTVFYAKLRQEIRYFDWMTNDRLYPTSSFNESNPNFFQYHLISLRQLTPSVSVKFPKKILIGVFGQAYLQSERKSPQWMAKKIEATGNDLNKHIEFLVDDMMFFNHR